MEYKFLVLDLDSTMVHTKSSMESLHELEKNKASNLHLLKDRIHKFNLGGYENNEAKMWTLLRPYTKEFMQYSLKYFSAVIVWSAGKPAYVHEIIKFLFPEGDPPFLIYTYNDCVMKKGGKINKPLSKLFMDPRLIFANNTNTLVIDDRLDTFELNHHNGILIPPFEPNTLAEMHQTDTALLKLMGWLSLPEVMNCTDYRYLDKTKIFTTNVEQYLNGLR
jgi:hypothetical protein